MRIASQYFLVGYSLFALHLKLLIFVDYDD